VLIFLVVEFIHSLTKKIRCGYNITLSSLKLSEKLSDFYYSKSSNYLLQNTLSVIFDFKAAYAKKVKLFSISEKNKLAF